MVDLYPHQQKAVDKMHNGCILVGDVGTGKTLTSIAYFFTKECKGVLHDYNTMREPKDLYIITTAKKRDSKDWEGDAALLGIGSDPTLSAGGVKLTVDSWNNIAKYKDVKDAFFIFDEQRVVGAGHWSKMFVKIAKQNRFILLSATPGDTWLDYIPIFLANGFYKNRTAFKDEHVVYNTFAKFPKVERYTGVGKLVKYRNQVLVPMPYERHTTRHLRIVKVPYDKSTFDKVVKDRWHVYESRPIRDVSELFSVMRKVVNSDRSRTAMVQDLLLKHPKLIVFYNFDYELEALRSLFESSDMQTSESNLMVCDTSTMSSTLSSSQTKTSSVGILPTSVQLQNAITSGSTTPEVGSPSENLSVLVGAEQNDPKNQATKPTKKQTSGSEPKRLPGTNSGSGCEKSSSFLRERMLSDGTQKLTSVNSTPVGTSTALLTQNPNDSESTATRDTDETISTTPARSVERNLDTIRSMDQRGRGVSTPGSAITETVAHVESTSEETMIPSRLYQTGTTTPEVVSPSERDRLSSSRLQEDVLSRGKSVRTRFHGGESLGSSFAVAEWNGHKHEEIPKTDSWVYLVQYTAGAEGWNCIETDAMAFYSLTYSYKQFYQAQGRTDRLNTPFSDLWYYIFVSDSMIDKAISGSLRTKKSFNESQFATKNLLLARN